MALFVHLHLHTEYSLVDGVVRIGSERKDDGTLVREGLVDACVRMGMPAVAVTDQGNLFSLVKFYRAAQSKGVKPLVGVDVLVREEGERAEPSRLVLLCPPRPVSTIGRQVAIAWNGAVEAACAVAATRRLRSARSARASASPRAKRPSRWRDSRPRSVRT